MIPFIPLTTEMREKSETPSLYIGLRAETRRAALAFRASGVSGGMLAFVGQNYFDLEISHPLASNNFSALSGFS